MGHGGGVVRGLGPPYTARMAEKVSPSLPRELREAIERYAPQRAILFGSAARGDADAASDIDLVLIKETSQPFLERLVEFAHLLPLELTRVDAFIYTPAEFAEMQDKENPVIMAALREGHTVYEATSGTA